MDGTLPELLTVEEVAALLRVERGTLYTWNYMGRGPVCQKVGSRLRYRRSDVLAWLDAARLAG